MLEVLATYLNLDESDELYRAAAYVLAQNLVHGDALTMRAHDGQPIAFAEWGYLGKGKFQRRDFRLATLAQSSSLTVQGSLFGNIGRRETFRQGSLFAHLGKHGIFTPERTYPPMTMRELAAGGEAPRQAHQDRKPIQKKLFE